MRLLFSFTVAVDPEVWEEIYGTTRGLREDVKTYCVDHLSQSAAAGADAITEVRAQ